VLFETGKPDVETDLKTCFYIFYKDLSMLIITRITLTLLFLLFPLSAAFSEELLVGAASDLLFVFSEMGKTFESETGNRIIFTFGSTGMLAEQIRQGAPYDIFAAADDRYIMGLKNQNLLKNDSIRNYAGGRLVIAYNKNVKPVTTLRDLLVKDIKSIAIANPDHAPYGIAAKEFLIRAGLWDKIKSKLILGENVRQALQFIQTGNADAGIIALSIAKVPEVNYITISEELHPPINQTMAILKDTSKQKVAKEFIDFVCSKKGKAMLEEYGYKTK